MGVGKLPIVKDLAQPKITVSDREVLELAQAREIYGTYCVTQDRVLVNKQCQYASKWFGNDGYKRILSYVKQMDSKELE